jgi:hypothetical protein
MNFDTLEFLEECYNRLYFCTSSITSFPKTYKNEDHTTGLEPTNYKLVTYIAKGVKTGLHNYDVIA